MQALPTATITFALRDELEPEEQDRAIERVASLPGVERAMRVHPDASKPMLRRFCFAEVSSEDESDLHALVEEVLHVPGVKSASVPARRYALGSSA